MTIDKIRRAIMAKTKAFNVPLEDVMDIVVMIAERDQQTYMEAYNKGYDSGFYAGLDKKSVIE